MGNSLENPKIPEQLQQDNTMIQGDEYEEELLLEDSGDELEEDGVKGKTNAEKNKLGKTAVMIAIIIVVVLGVILISVMLMSRMKVKKAEEEALAAEPTYTEVEFRGETVTVEVDKETGEPIMPEFKYTDEEKASLREVGYTGDDIEDFETKQMEPSPIIEEAVKVQEAWAEDFIAPYFDSASEEYKKMISSTWYGAGEIIESYDADPMLYNRFGYTKNCDYEKVQLRGFQCVLKVYLNDNGDFAFAVMSPERWIQLAETGNIVMDISYTETADGHKFITSITEKKVE